MRSFCPAFAATYSAPHRSTFGAALFSAVKFTVRAADRVSQWPTLCHSIWAANNATVEATHEPTNGTTFSPALETAHGTTL